MITKTKQQFADVDERLQALTPQRSAGVLTSYGRRGIGRRVVGGSQLLPRTNKSTKARWG